MIKQITMVEDFHKAFNLAVNTRPTYPDAEVRGLRIALHAEECEEVEQELWAMEGNMDKVAKELADLCYVIFGTVVSYGLQDKFEDVFSLVHASNMSKLGEDGKPLINGVNAHDSSRPKGKALKPAHYKPANVAHLFQ